MIRIIVPCELPTLNEIIDAAKLHWAIYSGMKKTNTETVAWNSFKYRGKINQDKVHAVITWYRENRKYDKDNVMAGQKFIFDGLKEAGVIGNDGWKNIGDVVHKFAVDKKNPRVEIELYPASQYELHYEIKTVE